MGHSASSGYRQNTQMKELGLDEGSLRGGLHSDKPYMLDLSRLPELECRWFVLCVFHVAHWCQLGTCWPIQGKEQKVRLGETSHCHKR